MPDEDKSLEILLKTKADLKDANALLDNLRRQILQAKLLGKSFADLQAQYNRVSGAIADYTKRHGEGGEKMKLFAGQAGQVKKAIRELSGQFPVAAKALLFLTNPVGGAIAIGIAMFVYFKEKLDDWNKAMDETTERMAKPDFADAIKARKDALEQGAQASELFRDKLNNLFDPEERYAKAVAQSISLLQEQASETEKVADAQNSLEAARLGHGKNLEEQKLQQLLAQGKITQEQFNADKLALDAAYFAQLTALEEQHEQEKLAREKKLREDILAEDQKLLDKATKDQPRLKTEAQSARATATQSAAAAAKTAAEVATAQSLKDEDAKAVKDAEAPLIKEFGTIENAIAVYKADPNYAHGFINADTYKKFTDAFNTQKLHLDTVTKGTAALPGLQTDAALDQAAAERAAARDEANIQRIRDAQDKVDATKASNASKDSADQATAEADAQKRLIELRDKQGKAPIGGGFTVGNEERFEQLRDFMSHGGRLNDSQRQFFTSFAAFVSSQIAFHTRIGQDLATVISTQAATTDKLAAFNDELKYLKSRIKDLNNR